MRYKHPVCYRETGVGYKIINLFIHHYSERDHLHNIIEYIERSGRIMFKRYEL